jgi:hypothetical protein
MPPSQVRVETIDPELARHPYRGCSHSLLRLVVSIAPRGMLPYEMTITVDDALVEVCDHRGCFAIEDIDQLFVVERQPPAWRFLTWFGVFARRRGRSDRLLLETPEVRVARYIERVIEQRLGLADERVAGELRVAW